MDEDVDCDDVHVRLLSRVVNSYTHFWHNKFAPFSSDKLFTFEPSIISHSSSSSNSRSQTFWSELFFNGSISFPHGVKLGLSMPTLGVVSPYFSVNSISSDVYLHFQTKNKYTLPLPFVSSSSSSIGKENHVLSVSYRASTEKGTAFATTLSPSLAGISAAFFGKQWSSGCGVVLGEKSSIRVSSSLSHSNVNVCGVAVLPSSICEGCALWSPFEDFVVCGIASNVWERNGVGLMWKNLRWKLTRTATAFSIHLPLSRWSMNVDAGYERSLKKEENMNKFGLRIEI